MEENMATYSETKKNALAAVHDESVVYAKVDGENDKITFDAVIDNSADGTSEKVPVATVNNMKMESHIFFEKAPVTTGE